MKWNNEGSVCYIKVEIWVKYIHLIEDAFIIFPVPENGELLSIHKFIIHYSPSEYKIKLRWVCYYSYLFLEWTC